MLPPRPMVASDQTSMAEKTPSSTEARRLTQGAPRQRYPASAFFHWAPACSFGSGRAPL